MNDCHFVCSGAFSLLYLCWLFVLESQMDDSGHRENGRHKPDQYKSAQGQVYQD